MADSLYLRRLSSGTHPLLGLHCALASGRALTPLARALPDAGMIAVDLPGHGRSPDWPENTEADYQGACVAGAMVHMDQPHHVVGHSFGATVALRLAQQHPDMVLSLTLIEPVLFKAAVGTQSHDDIMGRFGPFRAAMDAGDRRLASAQFHGLWGGGGPGFDRLPAEVQDAWIQRIHLIDAQSPGLHEDIGGTIAPGALEALGCPVTLVAGSISHPVIPAIQDALAARIPGCQRVTIDGAGHMAPLTHPQDVAAVVDTTIAAALV